MLRQYTYIYISMYASFLYEVIFSLTSCMYKPKQIICIVYIYRYVFIHI